MIPCRSFPRTICISEISWYQLITLLQTRYDLAYKKKGEESLMCLFLIREITGMELEIINPRADSGLTSILTRVKARPWHQAIRARVRFTAPLFIYASEDINRGRVLSERFGRRLPSIQSRISLGFRCAFPTSNPELSKGGNLHRVTSRIDPSAWLCFFFDFECLWGLTNESVETLVYSDNVYSFISIFCYYIYIYFIFHGWREIPNTKSDTIT